MVQLNIFGNDLTFEYKDTCTRIVNTYQSTCLSCEVAERQIGSKNIPTISILSNPFSQLSKLLINPQLPIPFSFDLCKIIND